MKHSDVSEKRFSTKKILATVFSVILILTVFTSTAFADTFRQYDVTVVDGGEAVTLATTATEPDEVLAQAGITLHADDKVDIASFVSGKGGTIVIERLKAVYIEFEGNIQTYNVYANTVSEALDEIGITLNKGDKISAALTDKVKDGMVLTIKSAFSVSLTADGNTAKYALTEGKVSDLLTLAGITLGADDYTKPALDKALKKDMKVTVYRVSYVEETRTETIKYGTTKKKDKKMTEGKKKVIKKGENGSKDVTYKVKYVNGKEESKEALSEVITKEPVKEVVKVGTKKSKGASATPNGVESKNGYHIGDKISGRYTHYCACATCNGNSRGVTTSGKRIHNGMSNPYYIACNWLPLGSVVSVNGVNYTVVDRGGSGLSRKGRIDIFTPQGHSACYRLGTGSCTIEIVRLGW